MKFNKRIDCKRCGEILAKHKYLYCSSECSARDSYELNKEKDKERNKQTRLKRQISVV